MEERRFVSGAGGYEQRDIFPAYCEDVAGKVVLEKPLRIVVDGGNGAGGEYCVKLLTRLGATVVPLYCEPDGSFPNHHPDPVVARNMSALMVRVREGELWSGRCERSSWGV